MSRGVGDLVGAGVGRSAGRSLEAGDVQLYVEGRPLTARRGDTVAAALMANGVRVFGRSSKYHRPRGYRCGQGYCSACAMRVDGLPGVRTCTTPVRDGMRVEREHAWPTADADVLRAAELVAPLMPPGFYYRWFRRSPRLWGVFERALARAAGQGRLPAAEAVEVFRDARCERRAETPVLVVGGGVSGLSAALAAADAGVQVLLVERDDRLSGRAAGAAPLADKLVAAVTAHDRIETLTGAEAVGWFDEGVVAVDRTPHLLLVTPTAAVLATGAYDLGLPFGNWDLPGVMTAEGALRLLRRHDVRPGKRAVIVTTGDAGHQAAQELTEAGVQVACVADSRPPAAAGQSAPEATAGAGIPVTFGATGARAHGFNRVRRLTLSSDGRPQSYDCDLVCVSAGVRPADDLARQARSHGSLVLAQEAAGTGGPLTSPSGGRLWLAGLANGARTADDAREQGRRAGAAAAGHHMSRSERSRFREHGQPRS